MLGGLLEAVDHPGANGIVGNGELHEGDLAGLVRSEPARACNDNRFTIGSQMVEVEAEAPTPAGRAVLDGLCLSALWPTSPMPANQASNSSCSTTRTARNMRACGAAEFGSPRAEHRVRLIVAECGGNPAQGTLRLRAPHCEWVG